jgi:hypothetical protein
MLEVIEALNGNAFVHLDSMPNPGCEGGRSKRLPGRAAIPSQTEQIKNRKQSKGLRLTLGHGACYLCNTHPKTRRTKLFQAVPLLRVHFSSAIVSVRRRGASRGRPVLVGSLESNEATRDAVIFNVFLRAR